MMLGGFHVQGLPAPQGSKRGIVNRYSGKVNMIESSKRVKPWRADVRAKAEAFIDQAGGRPLEGPLALYLTFHMPRPKGHYGTGRNSSVLKESAPQHPIGKPDLDKLGRAILDALTGVVYTDDSQVVALSLRKMYAEGTWQLAGGGVAVYVER